MLIISALVSGKEAESPDLCTLEVFHQQVGDQTMEKTCHIGRKKRREHKDDQI